MVFEWNYVEKGNHFVSHQSDLKFLFVSAVLGEYLISR